MISWIMSVLRSALNRPGRTDDELPLIVGCAHIDGLDNISNESPYVRSCWSYLLHLHSRIRIRYRSQSYTDELPATSRLSDAI